ncbi:hypothetical protein [Bacillus mesophilum]|uniref:Uncharacterized protein n=1 Tax=Bacillus mesophilum TaxID=1071718 RepID=A0A7V7RNX4_9BACI|nr:hypothetical protein [Bacillus mesophilum]KAB2334287.1 hypothetical protein F7732_09460 [Bacillus mesophilum]
MTVREIYSEALLNDLYGLQIFIRFLVYEKGVIKLEDDGEKLTFYMQDQFQTKMNEYLIEYEEREKNG